ncbi:MAG: hypothetical protein V1773_18345 [bacterium]
MRLKFLAVFFVLSSFFAGCSSLLLTPVNFAWPLESALKVDESGNITENRYAVTINVKNMFFDETAAADKFAGSEVHIIRNEKGFYFLTASNFKNVYVFVAAEGSLKLTNKILVNTKGIENPAFNQREPNIELLVKNGTPIVLTNEGIVGGKNEK